jgi:hypothetical protein
MTKLSKDLTPGRLYLLLANGDDPFGLQGYVFPSTVEGYV